MKATGIVRRIDDLGRVVIPKEIRRTMRIREGEPLEIYTDRDGEVIFKKYSPVGELITVATGCAEALSKTSGHAVLVCDRDTVIVAAGIGKKELEGKIIGAEYETLMEARQTAARASGRRLPVVIEDQPRSEPLVAAPIIADGDIIGSVVLLGEAASAGELEIKLTLTAAAFLAKQLEH
ncbi:MAG: AbrB/MazE/SpoVT family DNA-binding domain-containing protein [Clostridiales bacterium]|nr:AbrB/MazE/SpoVT family DNA-binding domain-containing protein [Clostridiales bacterium]